jgi:[NiFe] hydrogenase assembly HybE family chaperone
MTDPLPDAAALPSPAAAVQARFCDIQQQQMQGMPLLNPALRVQAVGFQPWAQHWLGVLVTPWFMNLLLLPRLPAHWPSIGERESRHYVFPAGVFEFIGHHDPVLGEYQACSLFSPMAEFADHDSACATAAAALDALLDAARPPAGGAPAASAASATDRSKRDFLFGGAGRDRRGP